MSIGTNGNDTLSTTADFELVSALDGDDSVTSTHNGANLVAGKGADTLSSTHTLTAAIGLQTQLGGNGDDSLTANVSGGNAGGAATLVGVMDGGLNDDTISGTFKLNTSADDNVQVNATGGFGADVISADGGSVADFGSTVETVVDAGIGDDNVSLANADAKSDNAAATIAEATVFVNLGNGDDTLSRGSAIASSFGAVDTDVDILGEAGSDDIVGFLQMIGFGTAAAGTGDLFIDGGTGNDTILGNVIANQSGVELSTLDATTNIIGGNGLDVINQNVLVTVRDSANSTNTIDGGRDSDSVTVNHDLEALNSASEVDVTNLFLLGTGNDTLDADIDVNAGDSIITNGINSARTTVDGGQGIDDITINSTVLTDRGAFTDHIISAGDNNDIVDSDTYAFVASTGSANPLNVADARASISGGSGADVIDSLVQAQSSGDGSGGASFGVGAFSRNTIDGGVGADSITAGTFIFSDSNDGTGRAVIDIDGGDQKDTISSTASSDFSELFEVEFDSDIDGGSANDTISSSIDGFARNIVNIDSDIIGGSGSDAITSTINTESFGSAVMTVTDDIDAGAGNDTITATMTHESVAMTGTAQGTVLAGAGNDIVMVTNQGFGGTLGHLGSWEVFGGDGNDAITAVGGGVNFANANTLRGEGGDDTITGGDGIDQVFAGADNDTLVLSKGNDNLFSGSGTDTYAIDPTIDLDNNQLTDFDRTTDVLQFVGLTDAGAPGLEDDIMAMVTLFVDKGVGNDVEITFSNGTFLDFTGQGDGTMTSIADLVDNPLTQLIA